jgi:hypothetical protein
VKKARKDESSHRIENGNVSSSPHQFQGYIVLIIDKGAMERTVSILKK